MTEAVQTWKKVILGLPDQDFFDIIRNYLGPVKTPYNKHHLIRKLVSFIEQNRDSIVHAIEEKDAALLSAIVLMKQTATGESLQQMFSHEKKYLELHLHLLNLEERLLIFRSDDVYRINPLFADYLNKHVIHPSHLIKYKQLKKADYTGSPLWINSHVFFGLLSLVFHRGAEYDEKLKKSFCSAAESLIPVLKPQKKGISRIDNFHTIIRAAANAGFLEKNKLSARDFSWWLLASYIMAGSAAKSGRLSGLMDSTAFLNHLVSWMPQSGAVHKNDIIKIILLFENGRFSDYTQLLFSAAVDSGLICEAGSWYYLNRELGSWLSRFEGTGEIIIGQSFEITVPPQIRPADYIRLCRLGEIRQSDIYAHYEINKQCAGTAFNSGMDYDSIISLLENNTGHGIPQNISFSLKNWFEEYSRVQIVRGMFLVLKKDFAAIIEKSGILSKWIIRKISDGVYLMDEQSEKSWKTALTKSGIETIPDTVSAESARTGSVLPSASPAVKIAYPSADFQTASLPEPRDNSQHLKNKVIKSSLRPEEKSELQARIDKKIIIMEDQIRPGLLKAEKSEARGIDYAGKMRIIDQAIKSGKDLLEIQETKGNSIIRNLIEPLNLDKSGDDVILRGRSLPDYSDWHVAVRKISLVKKLKASLYMP